MRNVNRWGLATGLAAALALYGSAQAQSATGGSPSAPPPSGAPSDSRDTPAASERAGQGSGSSTMGREGGSTARESGTSATESRSAASGAATTAGKKLDKGLQESLEKIHATNQAELHMAQMGQQSAQSPQVKEFAQKVGDDHQRLDQKLTQTVQTLGATLEGKSFEKERDKSAKDMDKLQKKTGADFDKDFMDHMVKDHERTLKEMKGAAKDARKNNHTELAALLEQAQTGMQGHLDQAKQIRDSLKQEGRRAGGMDRPGAPTGTGSSGSGKAGPTGASDAGAGGPGTGAGSPGSGANPTLPGRDNPPAGSQPGGSTSR
jgi:putative membrane protein